MTSDDDENTSSTNTSTGSQEETDIVIFSKYIREEVDYSIIDDIMYNLHNACQCPISYGIPETPMFFNNGVFEEQMLEQYKNYLISQNERRNRTMHNIRCPRTNANFLISNFACKRLISRVKAVTLIQKRCGHNISIAQGLSIVRTINSTDVGTISAKEFIKKYSILSKEI